MSCVYDPAFSGFFFLGRMALNDISISAELLDNPVMAQLVEHIHTARTHNITLDGQNFCPEEMSVFMMAVAIETSRHPNLPPVKVNYSL